MSDSEEQSVGTVQLPTALLDRIERRVAQTEFVDASAYVAYVLEEVLEQVETDVPATTEVDEADVMQRLRSLGYLDE